MSPFSSSELLAREGFVHAFSTRDGGVSVPPFASMNLARAVGDDPAAVEENYRRFAEGLGVPVARLFETSQVHGDAVAIVDSTTDVLGLREREADALIAVDPGSAVGVRTADCVPILLADPRTGMVSAVHAGWRGTVLRVLDRAIDGLDRLGARPTDLLAAIGPHIGPASFEVGDDVAAQIAEAAGSESVIVRGYAKPHIDLERVVRLQLASRGVVGARVERVPGCTFDASGRFHSFRRDGKRSGRQLSAIVARVGIDRNAW